MYTYLKLKNIITLRMNLLSCGGGGARGLITIKFLVEIERITQKPISQLFDYVSAASVGCIITSGLLISDDGVNPKYTAKEVHDTFLKYLTGAFSWTYSSWVGSMFGLIGPSYTNTGLLKIGTELCQDKNLGCLLQPVIFPAYDRIKHKSYYFERDKDSELLLRDVIMSCTAAPTYFESYNLEINNVKYDMLDGGLVSNAIELVYLRATRDLQCIDKSKILQLNIGTGSFTNTSTNKQGLIEWIPMIVNTLMNAHIENELFELSLSLPLDNYFTLNVPLDIKYYDIDNIKQSTIDYYIQETDKWIIENTDSMYKFCSKLMTNKRFDMPNIELTNDGYESAYELSDEESQ